MRKDFLHIKHKPAKRFYIYDKLSLYSCFTKLSLSMLVLILIVGCSANYQGPLRYSGDTSQQTYQRSNNKDYNFSSYKNNQKSTKYIIDTQYVIDSIIEECPLEIIEETDQNENYGSCPVIFDTITTGDLLTVALKRVIDYYSQIIGGNFIYKYILDNFFKILEIYLPDILDRILEILNLDELIEKQRYPEVYINQSVSNSISIEKSIEFYSDIRLANYDSIKDSDRNYFAIEKAVTPTSTIHPAKHGLDIVQ